MADGTTTTTQDQPWYQGADAETTGFLQSKGWDKKTPAQAALEAVKSYREAQSFVGAPPDQLLRLPKDTSDEAGWNAVWNRLGKPKEAKEYDFSGIKFADGKDLDEGFTTLMREQAFKLNLPKDTAAAVTKAMVTYLEQTDQKELTERTAKLATEKAELAKNWGPNMEPNLFVARRAAQALGVDPATVAQLENVIGYAKIMEMFRVIGSKIGEDKFITGQNNSGVMTRDQALSRISELKADKAWAQSYLNGDATKKREMADLHRIAYG